MNPQLEGVEAIEGTYVFDIRTSNRALKLNRFFWNMIRAEYRQRFNEDEERAMLDAGLSDKERALITARDWLGLIQNGANFFVLEKFARVAKKTNMEVYAIMRGETFEEFLATRKVPGAR
ncbi:protocatechuate 4,5-dioxygenase subunit alpha [soil metagenome]